MVSHPSFVYHAFHAIHILDVEENEQEIAPFAERWGGLDIGNFARALQEGDPHDQQIAAFALGSFRCRWSRDVLLPFLHHEHPAVRWAVAEELGRMREEEAFPVLLEILQEFLPPRAQGEPGEYDWYDVHHLFVANIVGSWGRQEAVPVIREVLARLWQEEQRPHEQNMQLWWHYHDTLIAALGKLGAFDALAGLEGSPDRKIFWAVTLVLGYLGYLDKVSMPQMAIIELLTQAEHKNDESGRLALVPELLHHRMGFSAEDAAAFATIYERECLSHR